jgi:hypothetical protein
MLHHTVSPPTPNDHKAANDPIAAKLGALPAIMPQKATRPRVMLKAHLHSQRVRVSFPRSDAPSAKDVTTKACHCQPQSSRVACTLTPEHSACQEADILRKLQQRRSARAKLIDDGSEDQRSDNRPKVVGRPAEPERCVNDSVSLGFADHTR